MTTLEADPLFKVTVSAHLLDWHNARYRVTARNSAGCSSTAEIAVTNLMKDTVGYFKPRAAKVSPIGYGQAVTVSADGKTMAVLTVRRSALFSDFSTTLPVNPAAAGDGTAPRRAAVRAPGGS